MASVQHDTETGWHWSLSNKKGDYSPPFATAAEAIADADREMRARGWVLIGETIGA